MNTLFRHTKRFFAVLLSVILLYAAAAVILGWLTVRLPPPADNAPSATVKAYLSSNGVHTDLVLPRSDWAEFLHREDLAQADYIYIGWGSRVFYTQVPRWKDLTVKTALKTLAWDESVLRISGGGAPPDTPQRRTLHLTQAQLSQLNRDLKSYFAATAPLAGQTRFYPARGRYYPLQTCNEWVRQRIAAVGVPVPRWSPFAQPLLRDRE